MPCSVAQSCQLFVTPWTVAHQSPLSLGFPRQEYWSGLPFPSPGDLPDPGIEPVSLALAGRFFTTEPPDAKHVWLALISKMLAWYPAWQSTPVFLAGESHEQRVTVHRAAKSQTRLKSLSNSRLWSPHVNWLKFPKLFIVYRIELKII